MFVVLTFAAGPERGESLAVCEGDKLTIDFEKAGEKKVVASYVSAADDIPF